MALPGNPTPFYPRGLYDSLLGGTAPDGACFYLQNLIHDITTQRVWVPRPGATVKTTFPGFTSPGVVATALTVGTRVYGMIATGRFAGHDEPFVYDTVANAFITVGNVTAANTPATQATTGDWTPPDMDIVGSRVVVTHPGFSGAAFFGWFDISSFSLGFTGSTHSSTLLDTLSVNPLNVGIMPGQSITGPGIPANTFVVSYTATTITLSQPATATAAGVALTAAGGTTAAPLWGAGNTNTNPLPVKPVSIQQFNNRAWFACNNQAWFTDALNSGNVTNATNFVTCGDPAVAINAFGTIPITQTIGGILGGLIVFKPAATAGTAGYWVITGDISFSGGITVNGPIGNVGLAAPMSVVQTPRGIWFMANDGIHQIDFSGTVSTSPIKGVRYPFSVVPYPTRAMADYNNTVYRISLTTLPNPQEVTPRHVDYWFDFEIEEWSGPHTSGNDVCIPTSDSFLFASNDHPGALYQSDVDVSPGSVYSEFGSTLNVFLRSGVLPDGQTMSASAIVEATIDLALAGTQVSPTVLFLDQSNSVLGVAPIAQSNAGSAIWGSIVWGSFTWGSAPFALQSYNVDWPIPLVFKRGAYQVTTSAYSGLRIGPFWARIEDLGYMNVQQPA